MAKNSTRPEGTPDWLVEGARVGVRTHDSAREATVTRFTATRVYLDTGKDDWFPLPSLEKNVGGTWGRTYTIVPATDSRFVAMRRVDQIKSTVHAIERASRDLVGWKHPGPATLKTLHDLAQRLADLTSE
jgi:hypothetical protein